MATRDILVIGASASGLPPLREIVRSLPEDFPAAVFVVLHIAPFAPSHLPAILGRDAPLRAAEAVDREPIVAGRIYVAPPDLHLLVEVGHVRTTRAPTENRTRPAADPLFRSAAYAYGPRVVGVVLSGLLSDGTAGLWAIKYRGGVAVVQEPDEAIHDSMPISAIENVEVDHRIRVAEMGPLLTHLARQEVSDITARSPTRTMEIETRIAMGERPQEAGVLELGEPSLFTCPECHGGLVRVEEGAFDRYRCHTGHAYSADSLLAETDAEIEASMWNTIRVIKEKALLMRRMGERARVDGDDGLAVAYLRKAEGAHESANLVRAEVLRHRALNEVELKPAANR